MPSKPTKKAPAKKSDYEKFKAKHPKELAKAEAKLAAAERKAHKEKKAATSFAATLPVEVVEAITSSVVPSVPEPEPTPAAPPTHIPAPGLPAAPPTVKAR